MGQILMPAGLSEGTMAKLTHRCVFEHVLELLTVKMFQYFKSRVSEEPILARESSKDTYLTEEEKKKHHYINSFCQTRTMERKSQLKTIKVRFLFFGGFFSVNLISYSCCSFSYRWRLWWKGTGEAGAASATPQLLWGLAGDGVTATLHPATCDLLCLSGTSDAAGGGWGFRIRPAESLQKEVNWILSVQLWPADRWDGFLSQWRAMMDFSPPLYEVLKPFLMDYLLLHLHMLYSVSLFFRVSFYKCVFNCFNSFWFPLELYLFSFCCISVLVWFGLRLLCVLSHEFSISKLS